MTRPNIPRRQGRPHSAGFTLVEILVVFLIIALLVGLLLPAINAAVDACNVVSLHSGLPISLVDLDRIDGDLTIRIAPAGTTYVFNPSGQVIDTSGLVCLYDAQGPTGTPVKDAQRTKTHDDTRAALSIVWGTNALEGWAEKTAAFYQSLLREHGAQVEDVR